MRVRVRLFAILREKAGISSFEMELPAGASVDSVRAEILHRFSTLRPHVPACAFAVNQSYVKGDALLSDGDEVALIPPVSGG